MSIHVVIHSYRHGLNAESSRSCEPFLTRMVKGRLSTEAHSVVLKRVNLYEFLGYQVVTAWMPASISVTVVRNSAADNFICCYLWWCYEDVEYLALKAFTLMGIIAGSRSTDTPFWMPEQGAPKHCNTPWHAVACLDPCWSFCIAIKIIFIFSSQWARWTPSLFETCTFITFSHNALKLLFGKRRLKTMKAFWKINF